MAPFSLEMAVMAAVAVTVEAVRRLAVKQQAPPRARCCPRPRGWVVEGATCGRISSTATAGPRPWRGRTCPRLESRKWGWGPEKRRGLFRLVSTAASPGRCGLSGEELTPPGRTRQQVLRALRGGRVGAGQEGWVETTGGGVAWRTWVELFGQKF